MTKPIDVPLSLVAPVQLRKQSSASTSGLFFPHHKQLPIAMSIDWEGTTHLIHLDGEYVFKEAPVDVGHPIRGLIINKIEFRVDVASRYDSGHVWDPLGALIVKDGELSIFCQKLGDQMHNDPYPVPLGGGYPAGVPDEVCGFTRWSVAIRDGDQTKVIQSFEAAPKN